MPRPFDRLPFLLAVCAALCPLAPRSLSATDAAPPATLKAAYSDKFALGAAIENGQLDAGSLRLLTDNFTNLTTENCLKPRATEPQEGQFSFERSDAFVAFAREHGLKVNAHTLVWHEQCPDWFFLDGDRPAGRELVLTRLRRHIAALAGHFRGQVASWDVVNEAIDDRPDNYLRPTKWLQTVGEDFIAEAFIAARAADPDARLYYNDYNIEQPAKRAKVLRLIRDLKARHAPIDGVGIQGHWQLDNVPFQDLEDTIAAFHAEGLQVAVSELDLDVIPRRASGGDAGQREAAGADPYPDGLPPEILQRQAEQYARLFEIFRRRAADVSRVTFWGLHDGHSWLNNWPRRRTNYPLLWGRDLQPKPALDAVLAAAQR